MEQTTMITDILEEIKEKELDFLPDIPEVKEGYMAALKFFLLAS